MDELKDLASFLNVHPLRLSQSGNLAVPVLHEDNGTEIRGLVSVAKHLARTSNSTELLGYSMEEKALVNQWMEYRITQIDPSVAGDLRGLHAVLKELNSYLGDKVYFVGHHLTLADILIYHGLHHTLDELSFQEKQQLMSLSRWFNQVQHVPGVRQQRRHVFFQRTNLYPTSTTTSA